MRNSQIVFVPRKHPTSSSTPRVCTCSYQWSQFSLLGWEIDSMLPGGVLRALEGSCLVGSVVRRTLCERPKRPEKTKSRLCISWDIGYTEPSQVCSQESGDIGTVRKLRLGKIWMCLCSASHPCYGVFYETCQKENAKYFFKVFATTITFIVIQFREGIQYLGQFNFSGLLW